MKFFRLFLIVATLLVPLAATAPHPAQAVSVPGAYQAFQYGFMIWQGNTQTIWVFTNGGSVSWYAEATLVNLPDNPVTDPAPPGYVKPISGFGRVWGNFPDVRLKLGWGLQAEFGYSLNVEVNPNLPVDYTSDLVQIMSLPDGSRVRVRASGLWEYYSPTTNPPPQQPPPASNPLPATTTATSTGAVFQSFEGGYMLWWAYSNVIWVFINNGQVLLFEPASYGNLSENPVPNAPPYGKFKPLLGFGKVWGHYPHVRSQLGWGTIPMIGYTTTVERVTNTQYTFHYFISFPNGDAIQIRADGTWAAIS